MTPLTTLDRLAAQEAGEHQLVDVLGQRRARAVGGDRVEPERDRDLHPPAARERSRPGRPCAAASASRSSAGRAPAGGTCRRCAARSRGSRVITAGSVMNGAASPRPAGLDRQRRRGRPRSPRSTTSWQAPRRTVSRLRVGDRLQLPQARAAWRRGPRAAASRAPRRASPPTSSSALDAEGEAHAPLAAELVARAAGGALPRGRSNSSAGPPGLDRPVDDLGHLEVRGRPRRSTRTSSPSRSSSAIHSRRSAGGATRRWPG